MSMSKAGFVLGIAVLYFFLAALPSNADFGDLLNYVPADANAVMVLNLEKMIDSPLGKEKKWKEKMSQESAERPLDLPPAAGRVVLASRIDLEYMKPLWEMAILEMKESPSMKDIANKEGGSVEEILGKESVRTSRDAYVVHLSREVFAVISPADRQKVTRWLREALKRSEPAISPFLQKRVGAADSSGTEIVIAVDLSDAVQSSSVSENLKNRESLAGQTVDLDVLTDTICGIKGAAIGVRIGEKAFGQVVVDFEKDVAIMSPFAKPLLLEALAQRGAMIEDFAEWEEKVSGNTVSLKGDMSDAALRQLSLLIDPPTPQMEAGAKPAQVSPGDTSAVAKATQNHFNAIKGCLKDLKIDKRDMKTWGQLAAWMEKYAMRIARLPILNVDKEMITYGENVSYDLHGAAAALQGAAIQSSVEQRQISADSPDGYYGYTDRYGYGGYGYYYDNSADKRAVRYENRAEGINAARSLINGIKNGTVEIRRKMTEKYQVEF